ncbi:hypothetical protein BH20VER2_BH20VER2_04290 [soil metagenome]
MKNRTELQTVRRQRRGTRAMALVEVLSASALGALLVAGTMTTFSAVQRSFVGSLYQISSQNDQNRVFSYLRRDLHGATSVKIPGEGTDVMTLTIPAASVYPMNGNLGASLLSLLAQPDPATSTTVRYHRQGTSLIREVAGVGTVLASSATKFEATRLGLLVKVDAGFQPRFSLADRAGLGTANEASAYAHLQSTN